MQGTPKALGRQCNCVFPDKTSKEKYALAVVPVGGGYFLLTKFATVGLFLIEYLAELLWYQARVHGCMRREILETSYLLQTTYRVTNCDEFSSKVHGFKMNGILQRQKHKVPY